jgi:hypothetical protein
MYLESGNRIQNDKNYNLKFYSLNNIKKLFNFSSEGYIKSRIKYLMIFILSFNSLKKFILKKNQIFYSAISYFFTTIFKFNL